jgi:hypothetical protein
VTHSERRKRPREIRTAFVHVGPSTGLLYVDETHHGDFVFTLNKTMEWRDGDRVRVIVELLARKKKGSKP